MYKPKSGIHYDQKFAYDTNELTHTKNPIRL